MLERKKLFAGIFAALLALNLYGTKVEAATDAETEEARMWGGFRIYKNYLFRANSACKL